MAFVLAAVCLIGLSGCLSLLNTVRTADNPESAGRDDTKLLKPTIPDEGTTRGGTPDGVELDDSGEIKQPRTGDRAAPPNEGKKPSARAETKTPEENRTSSEQSRTDNTESTSTRTPGEDLLSTLDFERHDHAEYSARIKKEAIRLVHRTEVSSLARLCRDNITEDWTLSLYVKRPSTYRFVTYSWDPIDETWEKTFESDPKPLSRLKRHLQFISSGKECSYLKGEGP